MKPSGRRSGSMAKPAPRKSPSVAIIVEEPRWHTAMPGLRVPLRRAVKLALKGAGAVAQGSLTILLSDDAALKRLNADFRGKDKPTNVLSFPAAANPENHLGDIAIAYGVTAGEAREAKKRFSDHATHLAVHGVLHLLGYDHETAAEANVMESLEVAVLSELGIADPYAARVMEVA